MSKLSASLEKTLRQTMAPSGGLKVGTGNFLSSLLTGEERRPSASLREVLVKCATPLIITKLTPLCSGLQDHRRCVTAPAAAAAARAVDCEERAARSCRNEKESPRILAITWPRRVEECIRGVPVLMPHRAELPRQMFLETSFKLLAWFHCDN